MIVSFKAISFSLLILYCDILLNALFFFSLVGHYFLLFKKQICPTVFQESWMPRLWSLQFAISRPRGGELDRSDSYSSQTDNIVTSWFAVFKFLSFLMIRVPMLSLYHYYYFLFIMSLGWDRYILPC